MAIGTRSQFNQETRTTPITTKFLNVNPDKLEIKQKGGREEEGGREKSPSFIFIQIRKNKFKRYLY